MAKIKKENKLRFDCPVCGENIINFENEEYYGGSCEHVVLTYSYAMDDFGEIDESMEEVVAEMKKRFEEEDNQDPMIDIIDEYAVKSNGKYEFFSIDDPNSVPPVYETIYLLIRMIDEKESDIDETDLFIKKYTEAISQNPDDAQSYVDRGLSYYDLGKFQNAIDDYTIAIRLQPDSEAAYYNRGRAYYRLRQYQNAIDDYTKAISFEPRDTDAYYYKACSLALQNKAIEACECLKLAIKQGDNDWVRIKENKDFDNIRNESCFIDLLEEYKKSV